MQAGALSPLELAAQMEEFLTAKRARDAAELPLDEMMEETAPGGIPRQNRSIEPVLLASAAPVCE
jgi:hypothetical protein